MNRRQTTCLWAGIAVFVLMGLFPPWYVPPSSTPRSRDNYIQPVGWADFHRYQFFFTKNPGPIDMPRLVIQWIIVAVVTGGLMLTFRRKEVGKSEIRQPESHQPLQGEAHPQ